MAQWQVTRVRAVAQVSLDDGKANALALEEFDSLGRALQTVRESDAGAVVLTGRPGFFSAGLNLKLLPTLSSDDLLKVARGLAEVVTQLYTLPLPTVAALNGHAIAGGAILALACDVRLQADGAYKFGLNEVVGGITLPSFGIELMRGAVSPQQLTKLTLMGKLLPPAEALAHGLVESVVAPDALAATALARAEELAELPASAYAGTKENLRRPVAEYLRARLEPEMQALARSLSGRG